MSDAGTTFHVTMLRTKSSGQIIYLEAGKDFVDLLLSFLVLPVGTIIGLLNAEGVKERKFGAMDNIFKSVEKIQESMLYVNRTLLTEPRQTICAFRGSGLLQLEAADQINKEPALPKSYHICSGCNNSIGSDQAKFSCRCGSSSRRNIVFVPSTAAQPAVEAKPKEGFVKKNVTYIVSNNLEIMPTSSIKSIDVLNKMKVQNLSDLLSIDEEIGRNDIVRILLASISGSETPLTDVFGGK